MGALERPVAPARLRQVVFRSGVEGGEGGEGRGPIYGEVVLNHSPGLFTDRPILVEPELFDALEATGLGDGFGVGMTPQRLVGFRIGQLGVGRLYMRR